MEAAKLPWPSREHQSHVPYMQVSARRSLVGTGAVMAGHSLGRFSIQHPWRLRTFALVYSQVGAADQSEHLWRTCTFHGEPSDDPALRVLGAAPVRDHCSAALQDHPTAPGMT